MVEHLPRTGGVLNSILHSKKIKESRKKKRSIQDKGLVSSPHFTTESFYMAATQVQEQE